MVSSAVGTLAIAVVLLTVSCQAFPSRPGACPGGRSAAVGHETPSPIPSFADQGYELLIDGQAVVDTTSTPLVVGSSYEIAVRATGTRFRGALIRVDGMGTLSPGQNSGIATACSGDVQGVGHTSSAPKSLLSGIYEVDGGSSVTIDVTVVERNTRDDSVYSYQGFQFAVIGEGATVVAPVAEPTTAPVVAPTTAPVEEPTTAPVAAPTTAPVAAPTTAPVAAPTTAPVAAPTPVPVAAPTEAPVAALTDIPTFSPTEATIMAPTEAPAMEATEVPVVSPSSNPVVAPTIQPTPTLAVPATEAPVAPLSVVRCVRRRKQ